jgi:hypothetical protein
MPVRPVLGYLLSYSKRSSCDNIGSRCPISFGLITVHCGTKRYESVWWRGMLSSLSVDHQLFFIINKAEILSPKRSFSHAVLSICVRRLIYWTPLPRKNFPRLLFKAKNSKYISCWTLEFFIDHTLILLIQCFNALLCLVELKKRRQFYIC